MQSALIWIRAFRLLIDPSKLRRKPVFPDGHVVWPISGFEGSNLVRGRHIIIDTMQFVLFELGYSENIRCFFTTPYNIYTFKTMDGKPVFGSLTMTLRHAALNP
jgi:hypothetical protein